MNTRSDCNVHHRKSIKIGQKPRLVEATFKKRERDTTSYYSLPQCAKKLKYKSLSKTAKEKFVNNFSNTYCSTNFIFFPGCEQHTIIKDVACFTWHELPFNKRSICDVAVTMKAGRNATFLDLCSLCPNPRRKTYTSLIANVHKRSTIGWLAANVVDCYVARTESCNSLGESISFGCIESCIVGQMLCENKYKNVYKAFSGALTTQTKTMRDNVFMSLLWKFHFLVMRHEKLTNQLTTYNSVESFDPDLLSAVQKNLVKLLSTFCTSEPLLKTDRLVFQSDTSSCGACVCCTIDVVAAGILKRHMRPFTVEYRMWVVYALWQNSATCNAQLESFCKNNIKQMWVFPIFQTIVGSMQHYKLFNAFYFVEMTHKEKRNIHNHRWKEFCGV